MTVTLVHIHAPRGHYIGQVRRMGHRRWETVTGRCRSGESALSRAALRMRDRHRVRVLFVVDSGWYEPVIVIEATR